jgi:hypothetical protein
VLLHGSGGDGLAYEDWADILKKAGIANFRLDRYTGRGLEEIFSDQSRLVLRSPTTHSAPRQSWLDILRSTPRG